MQNRDHKSMAFPASNRTPSFKEITDIVITGAYCQLSVCVLCLTQTLRLRWAQHIDSLSPDVTLLDLPNANQHTLQDWERFFQANAYDIVVLHGIQSELNANRLSTDYISSLAKTVQSGLVMIA